MLAQNLLATWSEATVDALKELTSSTWGLEANLVEPTPERFPKGVPGSYIALVGDHYNFEFGVGAEWSDAEELSKMLLFMEPDEEIAEDDVADAMNEIANIVGGGVKRRMSDFDGSLKLGLPAFFEGPVFPTEEQEAAYAQVEIDGKTVYLVALKHRVS